MPKNNNYISKIKINNSLMMVLSFLFLLFLITDKNLSVMGLLSTVSINIIALIGMLFMIGYYTKFGIFNDDVTIFLSVMLAYLFYILLYSLYTKDTIGMNYVIRIFVYILIVFLIGKSRIDETKILIISMVFYAYSIVVFLSWLPATKMFNYSSFFANSNTFGFTMFIILYIHLISYIVFVNKSVKLIIFPVIIIDLIMIYVSTSRTVFFSLLVGLIVYKLYKHKNIGKFAHKTFFIIMMVVVFSTTYFYPKLYELEIGRKLDEITINHFGKSLFSGRQVIFSELLTVIERKPIFGYGLSTSSTDFIGIGNSSHNMFLDLLLQTGTIGIIFYILILYFIWNLLYPNEIGQKKNGVYIIFISFFASIIFYQIFERSFMQGSYSIRVLEWLVVSIGIAISMKKIEIKNN